jgi:imidazolonepropionase-like amidohydrolase
VEAGVKSIEHGNLIDRPTADLMAAKGVYVVPTMSVYEGYHKHGRELGFSQKVIDQFAELMKSAVTGLDNARSAGVRIAHGSDLEGILHQYQSREFLLKAEVMTPHETIVSATATSAELIGRKGELGIIAENALADLIVVDGDPLKNLKLLGDQGAHMPLIMQGGRIHKDRLGR